MQTLLRIIWNISSPKNNSLAYTVFLLLFFWTLRKLNKYIFCLLPYLYPRCRRPRCQDPPVKKDKAHTYGQNNPAFELETGGTNKDQEHLYSEISDQHSFNEQYQVPNNAPVYQSVTPKSADDCRNNHYQALNKDYVHKTNHYQKPKDIGGEPRHVYENFGKHDDQTEV